MPASAVMVQARSMMTIKRNSRIWPWRCLGKCPKSHSWKKFHRSPLKLKAFLWRTGNSQPPGGRAYPFTNILPVPHLLCLVKTLVPAYSPDSGCWSKPEMGNGQFIWSRFRNRSAQQPSAPGIRYYNKSTKNLFWEDRRSGSRPKITNPGTIQNNGIELSGDQNKGFNNDLTLTFSGKTWTKKKVIYLQNSFRSIILPASKRRLTKFQWASPWLLQAWWRKVSTSHARYPGFRQHHGRWTKPGEDGTVRFGWSRPHQYR